MLPILLLAMWLGAQASMMSSSADPAMYFGLDLMAWLATALCALIGAPLLFFGLLHFARDVKPKSDG